MRGATPPTSFCWVCGTRWHPECADHSPPATVSAASTAEVRRSMHLGETTAVTVEPHGGSPACAPTTTPTAAIPTS